MVERPQQAVVGGAPDLDALPEPPPPLLAYLMLKFTLEAGTPAGRGLLKSSW